MDETFKITPSTVVTSELLKKLCRHYRDELCFGCGREELPKIRIRYVEGEGKFCYARFGSFFFCGDDLYVWKRNEKYAEDHNQEVVEEVFEGNYFMGGYACRFLYAGADTNYVDSNGVHIFVGDVLEIGNVRRRQFALGYLPVYGDEGMVYCFVFDNHFLSLDECLTRKDTKVTRIGTTFFQLDWNFSTEDMNDKVREFNGWHDTREEHRNKIMMARYTPNFDKEPWKYYGLDLLGVEYNWR